MLRNKKTFIAILSTIILLAAGSVVFLVIYSKRSEDEYKCAIDKISNYGIDEFTEEAVNCEKEWEKAGCFDLLRRSSILDRLDIVEERVQKADTELNDYSDEVDDRLGRIDQYSLVQAAEEYKTILNNWKEAVEQMKYSQAVSMKKKAADSYDDLLAADKEYVSSKLAVYNKADLSMATPEEQGSIGEYFEQIEQLAAKECYGELRQVFLEMDDIILKYSMSEKELDVSVQQVDVTDFPKMKLYIQLEDKLSGKTAEGLDKSLFCIQKLDKAGNYVGQEISHVTQLNGNEPLNVDLVADVSASMEGRPLDEAKSVLTEFFDSVQFDKGDKVELTSFSTGVCLEQEFTGDRNLLANAVNNLQTDNMTSLYDGLYTSVTRAAAQTGAKCVIAFSDGIDNYSNCDSDQVINAARRYCIPVFIIGIGDTDTDVLRYICSQTGGTYYNVNDAASMSGIYEDIYSQEKQLYMVEFTDTTGAKVSDEADIIAGYHSALLGGECSHSCHPYVLMSVDADGLYNDGPESVVEKYIKNYDDAMNYSDFSYIEPYLCLDSAIYQSQKEYVTKDFSVSLKAYEIVGTNFVNNRCCVVTTLETYYVQQENEPLNLMTQKCRYRVETGKGGWLMTDFADQVKVMYRINK